MKTNKIYFYISIIISLCVIILLLTGSPLLVIALDKGNSIPLGTFITWIGMISFPCSIYLGVKALKKPSGVFYKWLSVLIKIILILGILWVPISYMLAGNLSFSFTEKVSFQGGQQAMKLFWIFSYSIGIGAIITLLLHWINVLIKKVRK